MSSPTSFISIPSGEDLLASMAKLPRADAFWVTATGEVEDAELQVAADVAESVQELAGRLTLVSLQGPVEGPFTAIA